jgi:protein-disulfide isomerase
MGVNRTRIENGARRKKMRTEIMTRTAMMLAAAGAVVLLAGCNKQVALPEKESTTVAATGKWLETTAVTPEGGMLMGNPAAKVKLIEYGALTCSHCADFAKESHDELRAMIAKGTVSYEFRNFLLSAIDVPAAILARCGGPGPFFTIADQLFATQPQWLGATRDITAAEQAQWTSFPAEQLAQVLADKLGLVTFVRERGISIDKAKACLSDKAGYDTLTQLQKTAVDQFKVTGTPTFIINGLVVPNAGNWERLEPALKAAGA